MSATITLIVLSSALSAFGDGYIIYMYFKMNLRTNFALKMITYMSISDLIFSLGNLLYIHPGKDPQMIRCQIQAFILQSSELSCFTFCFLLNYCIYLTVIKNKTNLEIYRNKFLILGCLVPILLSLMPFMNDAYGSNTYCCGFAYKDDNKIHHVFIIIEAIILFFIPLWFFNIGNIYLIVKVVLFISNLRRRDSVLKESTLILETNQEREIALSQQIVLNMLAYPIILIITWLPFTIYRIAFLFDYDVNALGGARFIIADCQGICNSIAYLVNSFRIIKLKNILMEEHQHRQMDDRGSVTKSIRYGSFISLTSGNDFFE